MNRKITFKGSPLTLVGRNIKVGNAAPYFRVIAQDLKEVSLLDFKGKIKLVTSFPSIDTPVCDLQVKEFNKRAVGLSSDIVITGISKDLPFAQARFCQANDIKNILTFSDYKFSSFGINYGLLIKELNLLARAIIILDKNDIIRYIQIVAELTRAPDYNDALKNLEQALKDPQGEIQTELPAKCKACEAGVPALAKEKIEKLLAQYRGWQLVEDKKIVKEFKFKDFVEAKYFLDLVAVIAEEQGHHPNLTLIYNKLKITLTTHSSGGLTENDFIMAKIIDELQG
ncbi:MAG: lipid hydroperoxide peroxidase [Omnitrophica WOR_2 bacterium RIFOXYB2_FULL_45_11]|nr:MAG: lipid hydroperoxide peroxidase [Omnitrophica WOR_2 bacterium RIFOXYB2_FULL_45_11]